MGDVGSLQRDMIPALAKPALRGGPADPNPRQRQSQNPGLREGRHMSGSEGTPTKGLGSREVQGAQPSTARRH